MRRRLGIGLAVVVLLLLVAWLAAGWFFSGIAIAPQTQTLEEMQLRTGSPADYGLPQPEEIALSLIHI